jgi:hypothetical protein
MQSFRRLASGFEMPPLLLGRSQEDELEDDWPLNSSGVDARDSQKMPILSGFWRGGRDRDRTCDPYRVEVMSFG